MSGSSRQLTLKKGASGDQVLDLLCTQLASYLEGGPPMWMMHLHVNQKSDYDDMIHQFKHTCMFWLRITKLIFNYALISINLSIKFSLVP